MSIYRPLSVLPDNAYYTTDDKITISWRNSGTMIAYSISIINNATNEEALNSGEITSYAPAYSFEASLLPYGEYKFQITVYDGNAAVVDRNSATSDWKIFHIVPKPVVTVEMEDGAIYPSQILNISANYSREDGVKYKHYQFLLYDENKNVIEKSDFLTHTDIEYSFGTILANEASYYVQCIITSLDNVSGDSGLIRFTAIYEKPNAHFTISAETEPCKPYVTLRWTVQRVIGELLGAGYYVDIDNNAVAEGDEMYNAEKMNLQTEGAQVIFREGFNIQNNFTINIWVEGITEGETFFELRNNDGASISLNYYQNRIHAWKPDAVSTVHTTSDEIAYTGTEQLMIRLQQVNGRLGVYAEIV